MNIKISISIYITIEIWFPHHGNHIIHVACCACIVRWKKKMSRKKTNGFLRLKMYQMDVLRRQSQMNQTDSNENERKKDRFLKFDTRTRSKKNTHTHMRMTRKKKCAFLCIYAANLFIRAPLFPLNARKNTQDERSFIIVIIHKRHKE